VVFNALSLTLQSFSDGAETLWRKKYATKAQKHKNALKIFDKNEYAI